MYVIVCTHTIPYIGTLTKAKSKNQVRLELDMYFDELMHVATIADLENNTNTMHQYVVGSDAVKTMMHMLSNKLDGEARSVHPNVMEARVRFQKDVGLEYIDTIADYRA